MKKLLSILLSVLIIVLSVAPVFSAKDDDNLYAELSDYPVILVPGFSSTQLYRIDENGNQVHVWGVDVDEIFAELLKNIAEFGISFGALAMGDPSMIAKAAGEKFSVMYGDLACNPDGSGAYDLIRYCSTPEECNAQTLFEQYPEGRFQYQRDHVAEIAKYVGRENIYFYNNDFRFGAIYCANMLRDFIDQVLEYTGAEKVNLVAVSHGGQVAGTYLSLYGTEGKVNHAVLTVPALCGAGFAYDALSGKATLDELNLINFIEYGEMFEEDYNWLVQAQELGFLDGIITEVLPYVMKIMGYWGSMWDFVPPRYYEKVKALRLNSTDNAALIEASDKVHYEIMPNYAENFKKAEEAGTKIYIIAGYDIGIITGLQETSDAIICTEDATGATVAPLGQRFSDGYVQKVDTGLYQVSPSMTVDASTCFLPSKTWFCEGMYHGMLCKDKYSTDLMTALLLTDSIEDVSSNPNFPQFHASTNVSYDIFASFNNATEGFITGDSDVLTITNLSSKNSIKLLAVTVNGAKFEIPSLISNVIKPNSSISLPIEGKVPEVSLKNINVVLDYASLGSFTPLSQRTLNFTIMNGDPVEFDSENPLSAANQGFKADDILSESGNELFSKLGLKKLIEIIYNIVIQIKTKISSLVNSFRF